MARARVSTLLFEILAAAPEGTARVAQDVIEVLLPRITPDPTTPGAGVAGVTQDVIEVLLLGDEDATAARVTQHVIEALVIPVSATESGSDTAVSPTTFGYAS